MATHPTRSVDPLRETGERLYQKLTRLLLNDLASGRYAVGDRLPAERDLSLEYNVSRPVVREALTALEVQGFVDVRLGAGAFVRRLPGDDDGQPSFAITAFELTEARMVFEGEAAALAALHITDAELAILAGIVDGFDALPFDAAEEADRRFHLTIAEATRNAAIRMTIEHYWQVRSTSAECALLHNKARSANVRPIAEEHRAIVAALFRRDSAAARAAMRAHLSAVLEHLLFATEEDAVEKARASLAPTRARFQAAARAVS